jgi:ADP-ribose pyrophosphatase YjhB (NUDIX family)
MIGAFAIILQQGRMLLIKRGTEPHEGYWCPLGGLIEAGESPEEAVTREVREEIGLEVEVVGALGEVNGPITGRPSGVYLCRVVGGEARPCPPETVGVAWFPPEKMCRLLFPRFMLDFLSGFDLEELGSRIGSLR